MTHIECQPRTNQVKTIAILVLILLGFSPSVFAAALVWNGTASTDFNAAANWTPAQAPAAGDTITFSGTPTLNQPALSSNVAVTSVTFSTVTGGWSLNCGTFTLTTTGGISTAGQTSGTNTIAGTTGGVVLGAAQTIQVGPGGTLAINGIISGTFLLTVGATGNTGTLALSGVNANTGGVTLAFGTLAINNFSALGASGTFTVNGATSINNTSGAPITTRNYPMSFAGDFTFVGANDLNLAGTAALTANRSVTVAANKLTLSGVVSGAFNLTKVGAAGTLTLANVNTYTGTTTVTSGILQLASTGALGTGVVNIATGATLDLNGQTSGAAFGSGTVIAAVGTGVGTNGAIINSDTVNQAVITSTVNQAGGSAFSVGGAGNILFNTITGSAAYVVTKVGAGTVTFGGTADNPFLTAAVSAGTLVLAKSPSSGSVHASGGGTVNVTGGILRLGGTGNGQINAPNDLTVTSPGIFDLNGFSQQLNAINGTGTLDNTSATFGTLIIGNSNGNGNFSGIIRNTGSATSFALTKIGTGTALISGLTNTYGGGTTISAGGLEMNNAAAAQFLGTGPITMNGGTLQLRGGAATTLNNALTFTGSGNFNIGNAANNGAQTLTISGPTTIGAFTLTTAATTATSNLILSDVTLTGVPTFSPVGNCLLQIGSLAGPFNLNLTGGVMQLNVSPTVGTGTFNINGSSTLQTGSNISIANNIQLNNASTLTLSSNNQSNTFSGVISGIGTVSKNGTGQTTLSGASTYITLTILTGGTLTAASSSAFGLSTLRIDGGTLSAASVLTLGNSLLLNGDFTLGGASAFTLAGIAQIPTNATRTITVSNTSNAVAFNSIAGSNANLIKAGANTLILSGDSTLTGTTTVNAGTLTLLGDSGRLSRSSNVIVNGSATLSIDGSGTANVAHFNPAGIVTLNGGTFSSFAPSTGATTRADTVPTLINNGASTLNLVATATADVDLTVNTFTNNSVLTFNRTFPSENAEGARFLLSPEPAVFPASFPAIYVFESNVGGTANSGAGTYTAAGSGIVAPAAINGQIYTSNTATAFNWNTGGTNWTVNTGTVSATGPGANDVVVIRDNHTVNLVAAPQACSALIFHATVAGNATLGGTGTLKIANGIAVNSQNNPSPSISASVTLDLSGNPITVASQGTGTLNFNATLSGANGIILNGSGNISMSTSNAAGYSGTTTLNSATLILGNAGALGIGTFAINGGTVRSSIAAPTIANPLTFNGAFAINETAAANTIAFSGNATLLSNVIINCSQTGNFIPASHTFAGVITDAGNGFSLTKNGVVGLNFSNANTYSGATIINQGRIVLLGTTENVSLQSSNVIVNSGGGLTIDGNGGDHDRFTNATPTLTLNGGDFTMSAPVSASHTETLTALVLGAGQTTSTINLTGTGAINAELTVGSIVTNSGAQLTFNRVSTGFLKWTGQANGTVYPNIYVIETALSQGIGVYSVVGIVAQTSATTDTYAYSGANNGSWENPANWTPPYTAGLEGPGSAAGITESVIIPGGTTVILNTITVTPLGSVVFQPTSPATNTNAANIGSGAISGPGTLKVGAGGITVLAPSATFNGLKGEYYNAVAGANFLNFQNVSQVTRLENIPGLNTNTPTIALSPNSALLYAAVYSGYIVAATTDTYTISANADDGLRCYVNGRLIADSWAQGGTRANDYGNIVPMVAGVRYPVRFEMYQNSGDGKAILRWQAPSVNSGNVQVIPGTNLIPASGNVAINCGLDFGAVQGVFNNPGFAMINVNGVIPATSTAGLELNGPGNVQLNNANAFTGNVIVNAHVLGLGNNSALGAATNTLVIPSGLTATPVINESFGISPFNLTVPNPIQLNSSIVIGPNSVFANLTFTGPVAIPPSVNTTIMANNATINSGHQHGQIIFTNNITDGNGTATLTKSGVGQIQFGGTANQWSSTQIFNGSIKMLAAGSVPANTALSLFANTDTPVNAPKAASLDLNGFPLTVRSVVTVAATPISLNNESALNNALCTVTSSMPGAVLTVNNLADSTYAGLFTGTINVVKNDSFAWSLIGASTSTGSLNAANGTLNLSAPLSWIGAVAVNGNATLNVLGAGIGTGALTQNGGVTNIGTGATLGFSTLNLNGGTLALATTAAPGNVFYNVPSLNLNGGALTIEVAAGAVHTSNIGVITVGSNASSINFNTNSTGTITLSSNGPLNFQSAGTLNFLTDVQAGTGAKLLAAGQLVAPVPYAMVNFSSARYDAVLGLVANAGATPTDFFSNKIGADFNNPADWDSPAPGTAANAVPSVDSNVFILHTGVTNVFGARNLNAVGTITFRGVNSGGLAGVGTFFLSGQGSGVVVESTAPASILNFAPVSFGTAPGTISHNGLASSLIQFAAIAGSGGVLKTGAGSLVLTADNSTSVTTAGFNISGGTLVISSDSFLGSATVPLTLNGGTLLVTGSTAIVSTRPFILGSNGATLNIANLAGHTISGVISSPGQTAGFTKTGAGTLTLTAANTFAIVTPAPAINVNQGTLSISNDNQLGATVNSIRLSNNATLFNTINGTVTLNVARQLIMGIGGGTVNCLGTGTNGRLFLATNQLVGSGTLTKVGNGMIQFNQANPGFTGNVIIQGGIFEIQNSGTFGSAGTLTLDADPQWTLPPELAFAGGITAQNNIIVSPRGGILASQNNTAPGVGIPQPILSGNIQVNGPLTVGLRQFSAGSGSFMTFSGALSGSGSLTTTNIGAGGTGNNGILVILGDSPSFSGPVTIVASTQIQVGANTSVTSLALGTGSLIVNGTLSFRSSTPLTAPNLSGLGVLIQRGSGVLTLSGTTSLGGIQVEKGFLLNDNVVLELSGSGSTTLTGTLAMSPSNTAIGTIQPVMNIKDTHVLNTTNLQMGENTGNTATVNQSGGDVVINGQLRVGHFPTTTCTYNMSGGTLTMATNSPTIPFLAASTEVVGGFYVGIDGIGIFNHSGGTVTTSNVVLDNRTATPGSQYNMTGGVLNLGQWGFIGNASNIQLGGGAIRATANWALSASLPVNLTGTNGNVTVNTNGFNVTLANIVSGTGGIVKSGPGFLYFNNTANTFTGATIVSAGGLGGIGRNTNTTTVSAGAILAPGDSAALGKLTLTAGTPLIFNGAGLTPSIMNVRINAAPTVTGAGPFTFTPSASADFVDVSLGTAPAVDLGTTVLNVSSTAALAVGRYRLIHNAAAGSVTGTMTVNAMPSGFSGAIAIDATSKSVDLIVTANTNFTWSGLSTTSSDWTDNTNWVGNVAPTGSVNETLTFPTSAARLSNINTFAAGTSFNTINFTSATAAGYNITGNSIVLTGTGSVVSSTVSVVATQTLNLDLTLSGPSTFNTVANATLVIGSAASTLDNNGNLLTLTDAGPITINSAISGSGGLAVSGAATATLSGVSSYTGATTLSAGTLQIVNGEISPSSTVLVNAGTLALNLPSAATFANPLTNNGTLALLTGTGKTLNVSSSITGTGALTHTGAGSSVFSGSALYAGATTISNGSFTISGSINSPGAYTQSGGSTVHILGSYTNSAASAFSLNNGVLNTSGTVIINGASGPLFLGNGGTGTWNVNGGSVLVNYGNGNGWGIGNAAGSTGILNVNAGTVTTVGSNVFHIGFATGSVGTVTLNGGVMNFGTGAGALRFGNTSAATGTLNLNGGTLETGRNFSRQDGVLSTVNFNGTTVRALAALTTLLPSTMNSVNILNGGLIIDNNGFNIALPAQLTAGGAATGGLVKNGVGTLTLNGANTYGGTTLINAGILQAANPAALGNTAAGTTIASGASLDSNGTALEGEPINLSGSGVSGLGALFNSSTLPASIAASGVVTLTAATTLGATGTLTILGNTAGAFAVTKVGAGTLQLNGTVAATSIAVSSGTLGGAFTTSAPITFASAASIAPGTNGVGTINANSVIILNGSTLNFDLGLPGAGNIGGSANDLVTAAAAPTLDLGTAPLTIVVNRQAGLSTGRYTLFSGYNILNSSTQINVSIPGVSATASVVGQSLVLDVNAQATAIWTGTAGDHLWSNPANWGGTNITNLAGPYALVFPATATDFISNNDITVPNFRIQSILLNSATSYTLGGSGVGITGGITAPAGTHTVGTTPLTLNQDQTFSVTGGALTLNSTIVNGVFTPTFDIQAGTINFSGVIGAGTGGVTVNRGNIAFNATMTYTGLTTVNPLGVLQIGNGTGAGTLPASANILNNGSVIFARNDGTVPVLCGAISGSGSVTYRGTGVSSAGHWPNVVANNTYSGGTVIDRVRIQPAVNGTGTVFGSGLITILNGGQLFHTNAMQINNPISMSGTGWLETTAPNLMGAIRLSGAASVIAGPITLTGNTRIGCSTNGGIISSNISGTGNLEINNAVLILNNFSLTGVLSFNGALSTNAGIVTLSGPAANTYTGLTTVNGGTLLLQKPDNVVAVPNNILGTVNNNSFIQLAANQQFGPSTVVTLDLGAKLILSGFNTTIAGLQSGSAGTASLVQNFETGTAAVTSTLTINNSADFVFDGILRNVSTGTGLLAIVKNGAGVQTMRNTQAAANRSNYSGATQVNAGTLVLSDNGNGNGFGNAASAVTVNAGGILALDTAATQTYALVISGVGGVSKVGPGVVTLSGAHVYTGATNVTAGILNVTGTQIGTSTHTVASGATLRGTGTIAGSVNVGSGGNLGSNAGTLTLNNAAATLNAPAGANLNFTLNGLPGAGGANNDYINMTNAGSVAIFDAGSVVNLVSVVRSGTFTLITAGSVTGSLPTLIVPPYVSGATLNMTATTLTVTLTVNAGTFVWGGATNTLWSVATNWLGGAAPDGSGTEALVFPINAGNKTNSNDLAGAKTYASIQILGGGYTINASAAANTIAVPGGTLLIDTPANSGNTTLGNVLVIAGTTKLAISAPLNTVTLSSTNTFTGSVTVTAGTLTVSTDLNLGAAPATATPNSIVLNGGTLNFALTATFTASTNRGLGLGPNGGTVTSSGAFNVNYGALISDSTGTPGTLNVGVISNFFVPGNAAVANTYSGGTILIPGSIVAIPGSALQALGTGTLTLNGGSMRASTVGTGSTLANAVIINADFTFLSGGATDQTLNFTGPVTLNGVAGTARTLTVSTLTNPLIFSGAIGDGGTGIGLTKTGSGLLTLSNANSSYSGTTTSSSGTLTISTLADSGSNSSIGSGSSVIIGGGTLAYTGGTTTTNRSIAFNGGTNFNPTAASTVTLNGLLSGAGAINLVGNNGSNVIVTNSGNTLAGNIRVTNGALTVKHSNALGTAGGRALQVNDGSAGNCTLHLDGTAGDVNLTVFSTALTANTAGTIFNDAGNNSITSAFSMTTGGGGTTFISNAGTLTVNGSINSAAGTRTVNLRGNGDGIFNAIINDTIGQTAHLPVLKDGGTGTWTLNNNQNFSGGLTVSAGTVRISADANAGAPYGIVTTSGIVNAITAGGSGYSSPTTVTFSAAPAGGTTATATATLGLTAASFGSLVGGSNYTSPVTATITGGGGSGATATTNLGLTSTNVASGQVGSFSIVGGRYSVIPTSVTLSGTSTGVLLMGLTPQSFTITDGGTYATAPALTVSAPTTGTTATATASLGLTAASFSLTGGTGYTSPPVLAITGGGGSGATATATLAGDAITSITITNPGVGYTTAPTMSITGGGGTGGTATGNADNFTLSQINVINAGAGYTVAPTVTPDSGAATIAGNATNFTINGIAITNIATSNYTTAPTATIVGGTPIVTGTLTGNANRYTVNAINLTAAGNNYTSAPSIAFTGGAGTGATAVVNANNFTVISVLITNAGSGYITAPTASFSGGGGTGAAATYVISGLITLGSASNPTLQAGASFTTPRQIALVTSGRIDTNSFDVIASGPLSGSGALQKIGTGTLTLSGTNPYAGSVAVNAGALSIGASANLGNASATNILSLNGGTLQSTGASVDLGVTRAVAIGALGGTVDVPTGNALTLPGVVSGGSTGTVNKTGAGSLALSGNNTYSGVTNINAGSVIISSALSLGSNGGGTVVAAGATLDSVSTVNMGNEALTLNGSGVAGTTGALHLGGGAQTLTLGGPITINTNALIKGESGASFDIGGNINTGANALTLQLDGLAPSTLSGIISGTGLSALIKDGTSTLVLSNFNTYSGSTLVSGGVLSITASENLGDAAQPSNTLIMANGTLRSTGSPVVFGATRAIALGTGGGRVEVPGTNLLIIPGTVSGSSTLTKTGSGTLTLTSANTNSGLVEILGGTLSIGASNNLGNASATNTLAIAGGTLQSTGALVDLGVNRVVTLGTGGGSIEVSGTNMLTIPAEINGATTLTKLGAGTLNSTGANTYTGSTTVSAGTLRGTGSTTSAMTITGTLFPGSAGPVPSTPIYSDFGADQILNASSVAFGPTSRFKFVLASNGTVAHTTRLVSTGTATVDPAASISFGVMTATYPLGDIPVITSTGGITSAFAISGNALPAGMTLVYKAAGVVVTPGAGSPADTVAVRVTSASVTPVKIADFNASLQGAGVNVAWTAVSEFKNAGFNIYRRALGNSDWVRANPALIAGRVTHADEKQYFFYDWASAGTFDYKLESVGIDGDREFFFAETSAVNLDWNATVSIAQEVTAPAIDSAINSIALESSVKSATQVGERFTALNLAIAGDAKAQTFAPASVRDLSQQPSATVAAREVSASQPSSAHSAALAGVRWFSSPARATGSASYNAAKVLYKYSGVMLIPQSALPNGFDINHVTLQREGRPFNALAVTPSGILVHAPGYQDDYTDKDALFLRRTGGLTPAGKITAATGLFNSALSPNVTTRATVTSEYSDVYFDFSLRPYTFAPWFSSKYLSQGTTQTFPINTPLATTGAATLTLNVWSLTSSEVTPDHAVQIMINGQPVGETTWDGGGSMLQLSFSIPGGILTNGANTVSLTTPAIAGQDTQIAFLHSMSVGYTRLLDASSTLEVVNTSSTLSLYEVYNLPTAGVWVVDTRFTDRAMLVPTESQQVADGSFRTRFMAASGGSGKFLIVPQGHENAALNISPRMIRPVRLNGVYLATGPSQFAASVQPLLAARSREGIRGMFVDQEQIFDYYNHGRFGPVGIQKAVRSLRPQYVLLAGRTTYDYRNYTGANVDPLCPTFLVSTSFWAQATSDSMFGDLGRGYPEVAVGRLPVNNASEMSAAVNRILNHKGFAVSGIRLHAVADADDAGVGNFGQQLSAIGSEHPDMTWQQNYLGSTFQSSSEVNAALTAAANGGADAILYSGHGNALRLGKTGPYILDTELVKNWTGNTVFLQATCTANWMAKNEAGYKSIAIQALTQPQGGISASIASSTYMNSEYASAFMSQLLRNTQANAGTRWGQALMQTQQWAHHRNGSSAFYGDLSRTEQIFGDPAMRVFAPPARIIGGGSGANSNSAPATSGSPVGTF